MTPKEYAELLAILLKNSNPAPLKKDINYAGIKRRSSDRQSSTDG